MSVGLSIGQIFRVNIGFVMMDLLHRFTNRCVPYEKVKGSTQLLYKKWYDKVLKHIKEGSIIRSKSVMKVFFSKEKKYIFYFP
jgi:predicted nucleotide-binding protein (sugar kinase/HSP70/actin superfamily)